MKEKENILRTLLRRSLKTVLWIVAGIFFLTVGIILALQIPAVQRVIVQKAAAFLSEKSGRRIDIGTVDIAFTHSLVLGNIFIAEGEKDTLLFVRTIAVDVNLLGLLSNEIIMKNIRIDSMTAHISRRLLDPVTLRADSSYNFSDILSALSAEPSASPVPIDTTGSSPWKIRVDEFHLSNIAGTYDDDVSGMNAVIRLGSLDVSVDRFDLDGLKFHLRDISFTNTSAVITQFKASNGSPHDTSAPSEFDIGFGNLTASNIQFLYRNTVTNEQYYGDLGAVSIAAEDLDLPNRRIILKNILLENSGVSIVVSPNEPSRKKLPDTTGAPWVIGLAQLVLVNNSVQYDIHGTKHVTGLDLNHVRLEALTMDVKNIFFSDERIAAEISHTSFHERSGFVLRELSGNAVIDSSHAQLSNFTVETPASRIHQNTLLTFSKRSDRTNISGNIGVRMVMDDSYIAASDILFFQPSLPLNGQANTRFTISTDISGRLDSLNVAGLRISTADSTLLDLSGTVQGLPATDRIYFDMVLHQFSTGSADIRTIVIDSLLPQTISIPASLTVSGRFKGTMNDFSATAAVASSFGSVDLRAGMNGGHDSRSARWNTQFNIREFNLGALLSDSSLFGPVTLNASATGKGLSMDDLSASVNVLVHEATVNGYAYKDLTVKGTATPTMFDGTAEIRDSNIVFTFRGLIDVGNVHPAARFTLDVQGMDFQRLNITADDVRVSGSVFSDISGTDVNDFNGTAGIRNVVIVKDNQRYTVDSLIYASVIVDTATHISLESTIFQAQFDGTITPGKLPELLKEHFARYFGTKTLTAKSDPQPQRFAFHLALRDASTLTDIFVPELHELNGGTIDGSFDSEKNELDIRVALPAMNYGDLSIDSLTLSIISDAEKLNIAAKVYSISDSMFHLTNLLLSGTAAHDSMHVSIRTSRDDGYCRMLLAGSVTSDPKAYTLRLDKDGVIFDNASWSVPSDNALRFGGEQFIAENIILHSGEHFLSLISDTTKSLRPPLNIEFRNFDLSVLSRAVERQNGLIGGTLQGNIVLHFTEQQTAFTSDLTIGALSFQRMLLGDVALQADNQSKDVYAVKMNVTGNGNRIALNGTYRSIIGGSELDLKLDLAAVNLAAVEPFTFGSVSRLTGTMSGGFSITGTAATPSITGELNFANTAFNPAVMDSYLRLDHGTIIVDNTGVEFRSFLLTDTRGKTASLRGRVLTDDLFKTFRYDLRAHTEDFLALNRPANRDALYYGTVILDSDISFTGDQKQQIITIRAELDKGTNLALLLPESETAVEERRGIVRFTQQQSPQHDILSRRTAGTNIDTADTHRSTIQLTSNITVNKDSKLRILIDPVAGDSLVIRGEAALSFTIEPGGKITLTGRYEIVEGSYQLSFGDFIKREFSITKGSSLTWLGSPFDADVDITAVYTVKTSVMDLIQNQLGGISPEERNKYKQEIPVQVHLMMKGKLLTPEIHFKLDLPPDSRGVMNGSVYSKLNELNGQESELNKQVFALLVLGRFISENPLSSAGGNDGLSDFARSSVSQILSAQLNRLSQEYIKGVELNMGLESYKDYSTGNAEGRTQLQLALSKQLFNERVTVQAGGNVDLEGERSQKNSLNNFAGDLKVLYKLTDDGRWQLQVFRQNSYEGAIDGDITKTGAGVIFILDFDKLFGITLKPVSK